MIRPERPENDAARVAALHAYRILDTAPETDYDDLVRIASGICGTPMGSVSLVDADRQWLKSMHGFDASPTSPREASFCAHAILQPDRVMVVPDALLDARFHDNPHVTEGGIRFYAGAPLVGEGGHAFGSLCVLDAKPHDLSDAQAEALQALSRQVSRLMELRRVSHALNLQLLDRAWYEEHLLDYQRQLEAHNAELSEQTRTDPLTGLANRRAFIAALELAIAAQRGFAVALVDIDHFKTVNDVHGHAIGDEVLVAVAESLRSASGGHGLVARHGGEEFVWLIPEVDADRARLNCEYLRESVHHASQSLPVTVSVGVAERRAGESVAAVMQRADEALYAAKRGGRDRVVVAD
ncbi:sensor domain-containing diguanylate cyclase [Cognatilysobacter tabacisoli]|uniref:sensor domain-containing diguanylate cyclase n=1 Tax=Cognatilysobacter tabacisoli TaxID=2315424 RepID=UPI000E6B24D7|nr:sensor domain-containing diguanylate cyclase [Lysobacter tabacisoli]